MTDRTEYLALLRGINVGGKNVMRMADLRAAFEQLGYLDVTTYIQSGNVLFGAPGTQPARLASRLERRLRERFGVELRVVLRTAAQLEAVIAGAPSDFGAEAYRCDVLFLREPLGPAEAIRAVETREGIDRVWPGDGVLYFSRLAAQASRSRLSKLATKPEYQMITIRNWNTTRRLAAMLRERPRTFK